VDSRANRARLFKRCGQPRICTALVFTAARRGGCPQCGTVHRPSAPTLALAYEQKRSRSGIHASDLAWPGRFEHRDRRAALAEARFLESELSV
jgi:hypothetical protein